MDELELLAAALAAKKKKLGDLSPELEPSVEAPSTSLVEQISTGTNEGIAGMVGLPVDLMAAGLNKGVQGVNNLLGTEIGQIQNPVGGSQSLENLLSPFMTDVAPQNAGQRFGRRAGQEVGGMAIPGGVALKSAATPMMALKGAGLEAASAVGAGVGGQTAREIAPESDLADFAGSMIGGLSPIAMSRRMRPNPQAPSLDDLRAQQADAYANVENSGARLKSEKSSALQKLLSEKIAEEGVPEFLPSSVRSLGGKLDALPSEAKITDLEDMRRRIGNDLAGSNDGQAQRIGMGLKKEVDGFMGQIKPSDLTDGSSKSVIADLVEGRMLTQRLKKSEALGGETGAVTKALRRASTSGTGGNEVNAIRQNIRAILDNPKKRRGWTPEEIAEMEKIVEGTTVTNGLRIAGRLAPTSGGLSTMGNVGAGMAAVGSGNAAFLAPAAIGEISKFGAERLTKRQINGLDALVRNGSPLAKKTTSENEMRALQALIAARLVSESSEQ